MQSRKGLACRLALAILVVLPFRMAEAQQGSSCPMAGRAKTGVPPEGSDAAMRNELKRNVPTDPVASARLLALEDFRTLQHEVDTMKDFGGSRPVFRDNRDALKSLNVSDGAISEGSLVRVTGYLVAARKEGAESVNCESTVNVDFHINVGPTDTSTEWNGIVVEIIPQHRPDGLTSTTDLHAALSAVVTSKREVMVVGQLMMDNEHIVNDDPAHPHGSNPKRMSTWEIHPVVALLVCERALCRDDQFDDWTPLAQVQR